jgi:hypothetical protein
MTLMFTGVFHTKFRSTIFECSQHTALSKRSHILFEKSEKNTAENSHLKLQKM